jgi:hypothetical protein
MKKLLLLIIIYTLVSCINPSSEIIKIIPDGIEENEEIGLVAGMNLNDDLLLSNDGVTGVRQFSFIEGGISDKAFQNTIDENNIGGFIEIEEGVLPNLSERGSISVWVKSYSENSNAGIVHKGKLADYSDESLSIQLYGGKILFYARRENDGLYAGPWVQTDISLNDNEWYFLVATWELDETGSMMFKLYVLHDDENIKYEVVYKEYDEENDGKIFMSDGPILIGSMIESDYRGQGNYAFDGLIDEVCIYDVVRTEEEIKADYYLYK